MSNAKLPKITTSCKYCNGAYISSGWCPVHGLKFANSPCIQGQIKVKYHEVRVRNDVPWWKFWKSHYEVQQIVIE